MILKPKCTPVNWTLTTLVATIREAVCALPDARKGGHNQRYTIGDAGLGAFSVFFMHSPSFLDFQVRMQKARGRNNASSLFGIEQIPSMQQIRNLLDPVSPAHVAPVFLDLIEPIVADGGLALAPSARRAAAGGTRRYRAPLFGGDSLPAVLHAHVGQWQDTVLPHGAHAGDRRPWAKDGPALGPGVRGAAGLTGQTGLRAQRRHALAATLGCAAERLAHHRTGR